MVNRKRPTQEPIIPQNPVEELYLQNSIYGRHENVIMDELQMQSAMKDLGFFTIEELTWPTKVVQWETTVQHCIPGQKELQTDTCLRTKRVPMSREEAAEYYQEKARELLGIAAAKQVQKVLAPVAAKSKAPKQPTARKATPKKPNGKRK